MLAARSWLVSEFVYIYTIEYLLSHEFNNALSKIRVIPFSAWRIWRIGDVFWIWTNVPGFYGRSCLFVGLLEYLSL